MEVLCRLSYASVDASLYACGRGNRPASNSKFELLVLQNDIIISIMKRIIIQIEDDTLAELDLAAHEGAESRARFARRAIETALAERRRQRELQRVVDSFRKRPPEDLIVSKPAIRRAWPD